MRVIRIKEKRMWRGLNSGCQDAKCLPTTFICFTTYAASLFGCGLALLALEEIKERPKLLVKASAVLTGAICLVRCFGGVFSHEK